MRERMLAGDPYLADDPELGAQLLRAAELTDAYNAKRLIEKVARDDLLRYILRDNEPFPS